MSDTRSDRAWIIGEGHAPSIRDARIRSIDDIERLETELKEARDDAAHQQRVFAEAMRAKTAADERVADIEHRLRAERALAVYRLSSSSDMARPADRRGPEYDIIDTTITP